MLQGNKLGKYISQDTYNNQYVVIQSWLQLFWYKSGSKYSNNQKNDSLQETISSGNQTSYEYNCEHIGVHGWSYIISSQLKWSTKQGISHVVVTPVHPGRIYTDKYTCDKI